MRRPTPSAKKLEDEPVEEDVQVTRDPESAAAASGGFSYAERQAGFMSKFFYIWISKLLRQGFTKPLEKEDMGELDRDDRPHTVSTKFRALYHETGSLKRSLWRLVKRDMMWAGFFMFMSWNILGYAGPFMLQLMVTYIEDVEYEIKNNGTWPPESKMTKYSLLPTGMWFAIILILSKGIQSIVMHRHHILAAQCGSRASLALQSLIFEKQLKAATNSSRFDQGRIMTLVSNDCERVKDIFLSGHYLWNGVLLITATSIMLIAVLGPEALVGVAIIALQGPLQYRLTNMSQKFAKAVLGKTDIRMKSVNESVQAIRAIKFNVWEAEFLKRIRLARAAELSLLKSLALVSSVSVGLFTAGPTMVALATFATLSFTRPQDFVPSTIFPALSLFSLLQFPMGMIARLVQIFATTRACLGRIEEALAVDEVPSVTMSAGAEKDAPKGSKDVYVMKNADFKWSGDPDAEVALSSISMSIPMSKLSVVIGKTGAGKSALIQALLGEIPLNNGWFSCSSPEENGENVSVAYVSQTAWIMNATLRENILFGEDFDEARYNQAIEACGLRPDIEQLPAGDETEIGEKGINLSGGQRQRVNLARACYSSASIVLLDDPLSALDNFVGQHVFEHAILGMLRNRTRVLVTHHVHHTPSADQVLVMDKGTLVACGNAKELRDKGVNINEYEEESSDDEDAKHDASGELNGEAAEKEQSDKEKEKEVKSASQSKGPKGREGKLVKEEGKEQGAVKLKTYLSYARAMGPVSVALVIIVAVATQVTTTLSQWWIGTWTSSMNGTVPDMNNTEEGSAYLKQLQDNAFGYLSIYAAVSIISVVGAFTQSIAMALCALRAGRRQHEKLSTSVVHATVAFFDTTPVGRILNRFSGDIAVIDKELPGMLIQTFSMSIGLVGNLILMGLASPIIIFIFPFVMVAYFFLQRYYRRSSVELQRLSRTGKSPFLAHISQTMSGIPVVRAYKREGYFMNELEQRAKVYLSPFLLLNIANRWLGIRLEFLGTAIVGAISLMATGLVGTSVVSQQTGILALAISQSLGVTETMNWLVRGFAQVEIQMNAVERIDEYSKLDNEEEVVRRVSDQGPTGDEDFPVDGEIDISNLTVAYRDGLPDVLKGISLHVSSGEKIGVCGRTGCGKSTLVTALLKVMPYRDGTVMIGGRDTDTVSLHGLRRSISFVPQDPVLFSGSLRQNLDPLGVHSDERIYEALSMVDMKEHVEDASGALDLAVKGGGENFSVGQRQLLCLARVLLQNSKILIMDEATGSIDNETDKLVQGTLRKAFKDCTIITIAHRINTILDSDKIVVLNEGRVQEVGDPKALLKSDSFFSKLVAAGKNVIE